MNKARPFSLATFPDCGNTHSHKHIWREIVLTVAVFNVERLDEVVS